MASVRPSEICFVVVLPQYLASYCSLYIVMLSILGTGEYNDDGIRKNQSDHIFNEDKYIILYFYCHHYSPPS